MAAAPGFRLSRDAHGQLVLHADDGSEHIGVGPVRAFPLSDPGGALSLLGHDGKELIWIADPHTLPAADRALIDETLAEREFAPQILRLLSVSTFGTPSTWHVETDRGPVGLVLKAEEDIRRLGEAALLVTDAHGVGYRIADRWALDRRSRRLLERFL
jgi:hypothetical protein